MSRAAFALPRAARCMVLALFVGMPAALATSHAAPPVQNLLNKKAPGFALTDLGGQPLSLSGFRGKVVLLNFWATWCAPCLVEMPAFAAWQQQYGTQGLQVIGISMDDNAGAARRVAARLKLNYPVAMGDERLGERYGGVLGLPLTFLIDRNGMVRAQFQGETSLKLIEGRVSALLAHP